MSDLSMRRIADAQRNEQSPRHNAIDRQRRSRRVSLADAAVKLTTVHPACRQGFAWYASTDDFAPVA
jgi:hypothetical protein